MDDPRWLRLVTIGLVLAALAVGYFLMTGRFSATKSQKAQTQVVQQSPTPSPKTQVLGQNTASPTPTPTASPKATVSPSPSSQSAYSRIVDRNQGNVQTLPRTGFPIASLGLFSAAAISIGWGLKKFPH